MTQEKLYYHFQTSRLERFPTRQEENHEEIEAAAGVHHCGCHVPIGCPCMSSVHMRKRKDRNRHA